MKGGHLENTTVPIFLSTANLRGARFPRRAALSASAAREGIEFDLGRPPARWEHPCLKFGIQGIIRGSAVWQRGVDSIRIPV